MEIFGFQIKRKEKEEEEVKSFVPKTEEDTSRVLASGSHHGQYFDIDGMSSRNDAELIMKYRDASLHPEVDSAIDDIVNEAITTNTKSSPVELIMDDLEFSDKVKEKIREEFYYILSLLDFNYSGFEIFRKWYVDGRLPYHVIVNEDKPKEGIKELRYIDPIRLNKVQEVEKIRDEKTGIQLIRTKDEFYTYQETPISATSTFNTNSGAAGSTTAMKISKDAVVFITSGILDSTRKRSLSHLHKALKHINQLRMMEDSAVIYRLARAPERRIFYIDVGNLPTNKAEAYLSQVMTKYRNKLTYDGSTGEIKDSTKQMSMLEDFWLPRKEGGRGTEITTLPGGENLGQIEDIVYMQKKLYKALNVPVNRLEQESQFTLGRSTEISREEVKLQKFVNRLRQRFSWLFLRILKTQLLLKGIIREDEWEEIKENIRVDFLHDSAFAELKESEILRERMDILGAMDPYVGIYFSREWVYKNVLRMGDEDVKEMKKQIEKEKPADGEEQEEPAKFAFNSYDPSQDGGMSLSETVDTAKLKLIDEIRTSIEEID